MRFSTFATVAGATLFAKQSIAGYTLEDDYMKDFYGAFDFFDGPDPTHGFVKYVNEGTARDMKLINASTTVPVEWGVDTSNKTPEGRPSIRLESKKKYNGGLIVIDVQHMPFGCGTWPAFWMFGPDWPKGGEIDILEGVNEQDHNGMTLHTGPGCKVGPDKGIFGGEVVTPDCDVNAEGQGKNVGCSIKHPNKNSYGAGFNEIGGGVYATEWTKEAISIWYFPRNEIPKDVLGDSPQPSTWGKPSAKFQGGCDIPSMFSDNKIIFDTTFCGDWAGAVWETGSCASKAPKCDDFVRDNPEAFKDAYWTVNALKVYQENGKGDSPEPPKEDPPKEDPPKEDPPKEDPPKEDPPKEDPPKEDPPKEDPPTEAPPTENPPTEEPPVEAPPTDDPTMSLPVEGLPSGAPGGKPTDVAEPEPGKPTKPVEGIGSPTDVPTTKPGKPTDPVEGEPVDPTDPAAPEPGTPTETEPIGPPGENEPVVEPIGPPSGTGAAAPAPTGEGTSPGKPVESLPVEGLPTEPPTEGPVDETPPIDEQAPIEDTPTEGPAGESPPIVDPNEPPVEGTPTDGPVDETPPIDEQTPVEDTPTEGPVDESPPIVDPNEPVEQDPAAPAPTGEKPSTKPSARPGKPNGPMSDFDWPQKTGMKTQVRPKPTGLPVEEGQPPVEEGAPPADPELPEGDPEGEPALPEEDPAAPEEPPEGMKIQTVVETRYITVAARSVPTPMVRKRAQAYTA